MKRTVEVRRQCKTIAAKPIKVVFLAGRIRGAARRCTCLARAPAGTFRRNGGCDRAMRRCMSTSRLRNLPARPVGRDPGKRRFDEKTAADRIAVCSLKIFPATANR
jgi:hypothetical protein